MEVDRRPPESNGGGSTRRPIGPEWGGDGELSKRFIELMKFWTILDSIYARARRRPCVTMFGLGARLQAEAARPRPRPARDLLALALSPVPALVSVSAQSRHRAPLRVPRCVRWRHRVRPAAASLDPECAARLGNALAATPRGAALKKISRPKVELAQFRVLRIDARKFERMWAALIFSGFDRQAPDHRTVQS